MAEPFIGQIIMGGWNFAPRGYALCNGQLLSIAQNTALFSLLGTTFGGNGQTTFQLPNLQSRVPVHWGQGAGLSSYALGQSGGVENVTLLATEMPQHGHGFAVSNQPGALGTPTTASFLAASSSNQTAIYQTASNTSLNPAAIGTAGGGQPHTNVQPYLAVTFVIALEGIFPSRN